MIIGKVEKVTWKAVEQLEITGRNDGGFGHTGKQ
jgi:dUTPase